MNTLYCLRRAKQFHGANVASYRDDTPITWNEFYDRVHRAAAFFRDLGIQKGDRMAVWMLNSHEYLELYYATAMAGIVIVPLNTRWHPDDAGFAIADSGAVALVVDNRFVPSVERLPPIRTIVYAG